MADSMRTASGAPSQTARDKHGGGDGKFPIFDHKSAHSALQLRGHAPDPAKIIARVRAWANANNDKAILSECDAAVEADKKSSSSSNRSSDFEVETVERPRAPVELRSAAVADMDMSQRIVTVIVAPYEQSTPVMWKGEVWSEMFERSAWDGIEKRPNRVRANRAHNKLMTCGKAIKFFPSRQEGLVAEVKMANTDLGNETLELARDDCLSVSAGFAALPSGQIIDRRNRSRRIKTAYLDHISFVEDPAYTGAEIIDIRENEIIVPEDSQLVATPLMDQFLSDPFFAKVLNREKS